MYLVAKTLLGTTVRHHLHALDITTGNEQAGSPVLIQATSVSNKGNITHFDSLHQKNRPGLLLLNGILYMGFGSNYCNDSNSGWVLSYDPTSLSQLAIFNTSPDYGLTSIWQAGTGLVGDDEGNIFVETAEAGARRLRHPTGWSDLLPKRHQAFAQFAGCRLFHSLERCLPKQPRSRPEFRRSDRPPGSEWPVSTRTQNSGVPPGLESFLPTLPSAEALG